MTNDTRTCERCGATTPHEALAKLAGVNISQAEELTRLRAALERIAADEFSKVYQAVRVAADALNAKE